MSTTDPFTFSPICAQLRANYYSRNKKTDISLELSVLTSYTKGWPSSLPFPLTLYCYLSLLDTHVDNKSSMFGTVTLPVYGSLWQQYMTKTCKFSTYTSTSQTDNVLFTVIENNAPSKPTLSSTEKNRVANSYILQARICLLVLLPSTD
jgi:hypothetical protein